VRASVGFDGGTAAASQAKFNLLIIHKWWMFGYIAAMGLFLVALLWAARFTTLLRDPGSGAIGTKTKYSLAKSQMATWMFLMLSAYAFLWMLTGDRNIEIPAGMLGLLGISASTFLAAVAVDKNKEEAAVTKLPSTLAKQKEIAEATTNAPSRTSAIESEALDHEVRSLRAALRPKPGQSAWRDILTDADGLSLHRIQIVCWTILLVIIFIKTVLDTLALPEFSTTLLGLMGISAGTYIGFKLPEKK